MLADALTSLLAIFALLAGKYFGLNWMDPAMGIIGALLVARWSWGLLRDASRVLLDRQAPDEALAKIRTALEANGSCRITDLHVWSVGPGICAGAIAVTTRNAITPDALRRKLPTEYNLVHATIEVNTSDAG